MCSLDTYVIVTFINTKYIHIICTCKTILVVCGDVHVPCPTHVNRSLSAHDIWLRRFSSTATEFGGQWS